MTGGSGPRILYFDAASGIAGDMALAALLHAGADLDAVRGAVAKVVGNDVTLEVVEHRSGSLVGLRVVVRSADRQNDRGASTIIASIRDAGLPSGTRDAAVKVFEALARAEGRVHGKDSGEVHFHEVGALDSIADIVGIASAIDDLGIREVHASALPMGRGSVETRHGTMPLPAPATVEVLKGFPVYGLDAEGEFVTPTGAAVCAALCRSAGPMPPMRIGSVGCGFGTREWPDGRPNCVRAIVGVKDSHCESREIEISANIDDMTPDGISRLTEALFTSGALDAWTTPIQMKKGRPAWCVSAIATASAREAVERVFFEESSTIGVRIVPLERVKLHYRIEEVKTSLGGVRVKRAYRGGKQINVSIESDDLVAISDKTGQPLKRVRSIVTREIPD